MKFIKVNFMSFEKTGSKTFTGTRGILGFYKDEGSSRVLLGCGDLYCCDTTPSFQR